MENLKDKIYEQVKERDEQGQGKSRICEKLSRILNVEVPLELIEEILSEIRAAKKNSKSLSETINSKELEKQNGGLKKMVKEVGEDKKFDYDENNDMIIFYPEGKPHGILRTTVEAMFEKYVNGGENLSGKQMQLEFELTPKVWLFIKNVMNLYKDSSPFDIVTLRNMNHEDMEKIAQEKADRLTDAKMKRVYSEAEKRFKDSIINKYAKSNMGYDIFLEKLERAIKLYKPREVNITKIPQIDNNLTKYVIFGDAHLGKKGTDGIVIRIKKMTNELISSPEKNIDITFLGDIGECFVPYPNSMHPDQRLGMENINTEDLVMLAVDVLEDMLISLYKAGKNITFNGLGGNHGRLTERKEFDPHRSAEMIIYRFLQKIVENTNIKINILRDNINIIKSGNVKYVFLHGDELTPAKLQRIAMQELEDKYFLCICSADKHHLKITEISDRVTRIQSPSLSGKGRFDENLALSSLSGYIELYKNKDGLIDINVKRLK